ncbi:MAG: Rrf2 family transcriptional regulator [Saprospiraceae bacterium]|nr:Rrf2 family transcriptional regulator [Saprospiraceae bacterium]
MLSKKTQYAMKALSYLAARRDQGPVLITDIAEQKKIPVKFLENILLELKNAHILESKKGRGGGYFLKDAPNKTSLATIIRIVDGPIALLPCVSLYFYQKCADCTEEVCPINAVFIQVRDATLEVLESKTLEDIQEMIEEAIDFSI